MSERKWTVEVDRESLEAVILLLAERGQKWVRVDGREYDRETGLVYGASRIIDGVLPVAPEARQAIVRRELAVAEHIIEGRKQDARVAPKVT